MRWQLNEGVRASELLIQQAVDGLRRYETALSKGASTEEVERLRMMAESLFQAVTEHHLRAAGCYLSTLH
ncbi:hypothetical protein CCU68_06610 [Pseudomonas gingeri NCPPB 3146 = LMG 5327]|uniref:Uncharacterized protein n=1 Tax=Pseudomonas gingeri NCPPB 3146 = LMG 5327 TaxID=707248 RepID=A0ABX4Y8R2_9PSED|nr:hypothetical protein [Pseudomonas gingeri]PNQ93390.1 hypothetical protein CCU68_06610 [Pseudomonas gingeri NCPPB 3146 = LMG 5327]